VLRVAACAEARAVPSEKLPNPSTFPRRSVLLLLLLLLLCATPFPIRQLPATHDRRSVVRLGLAERQAALARV
jgi:hypothetical protein